MAGIGKYKGEGNFEMEGFGSKTGLDTVLNKNGDEGKELGPVKPKSIVDADPYGVYDDSEHNVAARRTEGTVEEQAAHREVDPDAPGTLREPGYEPPVKRFSLISKTKKNN